jgi:hypothetical protein
MYYSEVDTGEKGRSMFVIETMSSIIDHKLSYINFLFPEKEAKSLVVFRRRQFKPQT